MLVPGRVEQWNVVVDLRGCDQKKIKNVYDVAVKNFRKIIYAYPFRLKHLLVIENKKWKKWDRWEGVDANPSEVLLKNLFVDLNISGIEKRTSMVEHLKTLNKYIPPE